MFKRLFVLLAVVLSSFFVGVAPATAAIDLTKEYDAYFNDPVIDSPALTNALVDWINAAATNSKIDIAVLNLQDNPTGSEFDRIAAALSQAKTQRGVTVRVIWERCVGVNGVCTAASEQAARVVLKGIASWKEAVNGICGTTTDAAMHNKFMTISDTTESGIDPRTVQMTANWTDPHLKTEAYNSAIMLSNSSIYAGYKGYFDDMWANSCPDPLAVSAGTDLRVDFFPRTTDQVEIQINKIGCSGTTVRVAMAPWSANPGGTARGNDLLDALEARAACGATVKVLANKGAPIAPFLASTPNVAEKCLQGPDPVMHSKYMLVEGTWDGVSGSKVIFTGSHYFGESALNDDDEAWVKAHARSGSPIDLAVSYNLYSLNFETVYNSLNAGAC